MRWTLGIALFAGSAAACAGSAPLESSTGKRDARAATAPVENEPAEAELSPDEALRRADELYSSQLAAAARDERFAVGRQLSMLSEAVALYRVFIERAAKDPKTMILIQRSRERMLDAEVTIAVLRDTLAKESRRPR